MASCEKCWNDAYDYGMSDQAENYARLIKERNGICTPEEQAGEGAKLCPECNRYSRHIHCHVCMNCGYKGSK